jgi:hypothetical protein
MNLSTLKEICLLAINTSIIMPRKIITSQENKGKHKKPAYRNAEANRNKTCYEERMKSERKLFGRATERHTSNWEKAVWTNETIQSFNAKRKMPTMNAREAYDGYT